MSVKRIPRARAANRHVRVSGRTWNMVADWLESLLNMSTSGGIRFRSSRQGAALTLELPPQAIVAKTTAAGLPGALDDSTPGEGDVIVWRFDSDQTAAPTINLERAYNFFAEIGPDERVICVRERPSHKLLVLGAAPGVAAAEPCKCREESYEVEVDCGTCHVMPRYWWVDVGSSEPAQGAPQCTGTSCALAEGATVRMEHAGGCSWAGEEGSACILAELELDGVTWALRLYDQDDCLLGHFEMDRDEFACCGVNAGWVRVGGACEMAVVVRPDECTCCPPDPICPPPGVPVCPAVECCLEGLCSVTVQDPALSTPSNPDPALDCAKLGGVHTLNWVGPCHWMSEPNEPWGVFAEVTIEAPFTVTAIIRGRGGQVATYRQVFESCLNARQLTPAPLTLPHVIGESTCEPTMIGDASVQFQG